MDCPHIVEYFSITSEDNWINVTDDVHTNIHIQTWRGCRTLSALVELGLQQCDRCRQCYKNLEKDVFEKAIRVRSRMKKSYSDKQEKCNSEGGKGV